jgi:nucleoside-triphosphatase
MGPALLLTGRPGVGKTTVIRAVIDRSDMHAGGFLTEEIRKGGQRVGFRLVALDRNTETATLADVKSASPHRVGKYGVNLDELERVGVAALRRAVERPGVGLIVIDEIGKMELLSGPFRAAVEASLESAKPVLASVMLGRQPWVDALKTRPEVRLVQTTTANRRDMPEQVLRWLSQARAPSHAA